MTDKQIQNLVSGGIAVMFGFVAFTIINKMLNKNGSNGGGTMLAMEPTASASGLPCGAESAPSTFISGTNGCNFLENCEANGGTGSATPQGSGYALSCSGGGSMVTNTGGGSTFAPVRRTRSFF